MSEAVSILILEDEALSAMTLRIMLVKEGYRVCSILSKGEDAILFVKKERPDIMLFDNRLAGEISGIEAACEIKKEYDIPVIFITGYEINEFVREAEVAAPEACLSKPVDFAILENAIKKAINRKSRFNSPQQR